MPWISFIAEVLFLALAVSLVIGVFCGAFEAIQVKTGMVLPYLKRRREHELAEANYLSRRRKRINTQAIDHDSPDYAKYQARLKEGYSAVISDFSFDIERHDLTSYVYDEARLSHPKAVIRAAIFRTIEEQRQGTETLQPLSAALSFLACYQKGIGKIPLPKTHIAMMLLNGIEHRSLVDDEYIKISAEYSDKFDMLSERLKDVTAASKAESKRDLDDLKALERLRV